MQHPVRRRAFLKKCGLGVAGLAAIHSPRIALGYPANETLRVGAIGTGGRCRRALIPAAKKVPGVKIVAACDVWDGALEPAKALVEPGSLATRHYEEVLDRRDIDAVIVGTPDHWHVPVTIDACKAGKDVYVEKPLTWNIAEGKSVVAAQNDHQRIVQVGMQQRSMPHFKKGFEIIRSGELGEVNKVHLTWNRNSKLRHRKFGIDPKSVDWRRWLGRAKDRPFDDYLLRNFRWFWEFGGGILTDLMVHYIDVANWFLDLTHPTTAASIGDFIQAKEFWETPDSIQTLLHYPDKRLEIYFEGTFSNARNGAMLEFMGRKATLYMDRGHCEIHTERAHGGGVRDLSPGKDHRGSDFDRNVDGGLHHMQNWVDCIRSRKKPNAPAEAGVWAASGAHLGNIAFRSGEVARWSEQASG